AWREDEEVVKNLPVTVSPRVRPADADPSIEADPRIGPLIPLSEVADVRIAEGPATIKSGNGLLGNYVRLTVRDGDVAALVEEAREAVGREVALPAGVYVEWTGQFEHELRARKTVMLILPLVLGLIVLTLYLTYHDWADVGLMILAVPGAVAGGIFFQWVFGSKSSVGGWRAYNACFGTAAR